MPSSQYATPIILRPDGTATALERTDLSRTGEGTYDEGWLQDLLFRNPSAIPVDQIDRTCERLVPVCRELGTPVGPLDIFYATPTGQLVLVEAKLWRNSEARRKVIGQILDYATEISRWTYEDLQREVSRATKLKGNALYDIVRAKHPDTDEARFIDEVTRNLRAGRFLLLVIGDGIREGASAIAGFLQRSGTLSFTLAMVEMAIHDLPGGERLVLPRILARTVEVERSVVVLTDPRLSVGTGEPASSETDPDDSGEDDDRILRLWSDFVAQLRLDDQSQPIPRGSRDSNLYFPQPTAGHAWLSARLGVYGGKYAGVRVGFSKSSEAMAIYDALLAERVQIETELNEPLDWNQTTHGRKSIGLQRQFHDIYDPAERPAVFSYLSDAVNRMVNAFRPRLEKLASPPA